MQIILSLGSNNNAEQNIQMAEERLKRLFPVIRFSRTLMNEPYTPHPLIINNEQLTINNYDYQKTEVEGNSQHPSPNTQHPLTINNEQLTMNNYDYQKTEVEGNSQHPSPNTQHPTSHTPHPSLFGNAIGIGETALPFYVLRSAMKALEAHLGRTPERKHQGIIDMDIDILQYGDTKMKLDDWQRSYNKELLKELGY